ncbi:hypothetical protein EJ03DRAFT_322583 [Teratosphaeria nubilosa]|uniref:Arylsulfotransferase n=1 Tax=Teratosphaeria nubilosa TaxID=161662 RepID=A0A6G1KU20_9PEZI|nr:hypothetical protein EJ03DRAFT_322583 [Teratosphaeria nubilosa]
MAVQWLPFAALALFTFVQGALDLAFGSDDDLTHFVTRPDIKAPILDVKIYDRDAVLPGKWFVAPYADIAQQSHARNYYQPCQTGPAIYDLDGELMWSGACMLKNRNTCDFRTFYENGTNHLSMIIHGYSTDTLRHGLFLDNTYRIAQEIDTGTKQYPFNMHELNIKTHDVDQHSTALYILNRKGKYDVTTLGIENVTEGWVGDTGFREVDLITGEVLFEWWPAEHIALDESSGARDGLQGPAPKSWNWFHMNSVEKNGHGDYLISARWTNAIYKISGQTGKVLWRLGGTRSSFMPEGFNFSRQHDAQWLDYDDDFETISFLDNAADPNSRTANISSVLIVDLDKRSRPPTATVLSRIWRPDGKLSLQRGNYQRFPNSGNTLASWSDNAYMTEHDEDGRMVLEARFRSDRFVTYRSYKFNFTGAPSEPIAVKSLAFGESAEAAVTVVYVSWNGATEVREWRFYGRHEFGEEKVVLGVKGKSGFETVFQKNGWFAQVWVEGIDAKGEVLGCSEWEGTVAPGEWSTEDAAGLQTDETVYKAEL